MRKAKDFVKNKKNRRKTHTHREREWEKKQEMKWIDRDKEWKKARGRTVLVRGLFEECIPFSYRFWLISVMLNDFCVKRHKGFQHWKRLNGDGNQNLRVFLLYVYLYIRIHIYFDFKWFHVRVRVLVSLCLFQTILYATDLLKECTKLNW